VRLRESLSAVVLPVTAVAVVVEVGVAVAVEAVEAVEAAEVAVVDAIVRMFVIASSCGMVGKPLAAGKNSQRRFCDGVAFSSSHWKIQMMLTLKYSTLLTRFGAKMMHLKIL
jgi:hypothetical protein